jgi:hypothetical protein
MWVPQPLATLTVSTVCTGITLPLFYMDSNSPLQDAWSLHLSNDNFRNSYSAFLMDSKDSNVTLVTGGSWRSRVLQLWIAFSWWRLMPLGFSCYGTNSLDRTLGYSSIIRRMFYLKFSLYRKSDRYRIWVTVYDSRALLRDHWVYVVIISA